jgi:hypothetical protein
MQRERPQSEQGISLGHTPKSPKMGVLNNMFIFESVGRVRGHLMDSYDECVSFGDLMEDRKHT